MWVTARTNRMLTQKGSYQLADCYYRTDGSLVEEVFLSQACDNTASSSTSGTQASALTIRYTRCASTDRNGNALSLFNDPSAYTRVDDGRAER